LHLPDAFVVQVVVVGRAVVAVGRGLVVVVLGRVVVVLGRVVAVGVRGGEAIGATSGGG